MRRLALAIVLTLFGALPAWATTPTLVQKVNGGVQTVGDTSFVYRLAAPTKAGNTLIGGCQWGGSAVTISIADDQSQTWTNDVTVTDGGNNQAASQLHFSNTAANVQKITVTPSSSASVSCFFQEWNNIDTTPVVVTASGNPASTTAVATGAMTPTANNANGGNLIVQFAYQDSITPPWNGGNFTAQASWTLRAAMRGDGMAAQSFIQTSQAAITPTITAGTSATWLTTAVSFKASASAQGSAGSGMRVVGINHFAYYNGETTTLHAEGIPMDAGSTGIIVAWLGICATQPCGPTSITDSASNTYTETTCGQVHAGAAGTADIWYVKNASVSATTNNFVPVTNQTINAGSTILVYEIAGNDTAAFFDTCGTATGLQNAAGNLATATTTPTTSSGILLGLVGINSHTTSGVTGSWVFHSILTPAEDGVDLKTDQSNGWATLANASTSAQGPTWTFQHNTAGVQDWVSLTVSFLAPSVGSGLFPPWLPFDRHSTLLRMAGRSNFGHGRGQAWLHTVLIIALLISLRTRRTARRALMPPSGRCRPAGRGRIA